jgi:hypothetical protein
MFFFFFKIYITNYEYLNNDMLHSKIIIVNEK